MRQVHDGLMLHDVYVFDPCSKEATGSYEKWNFVVATGVLNFTDNQVKKIRCGIVRSKNKVRSIFEIIVILTERIPAILINKLNQQFTDIDK